MLAQIGPKLGQILSDLGGFSQFLEGFYQVSDDLGTYQILAKWTRSGTH